MPDDPGGLVRSSRPTRPGPAEHVRAWRPQLAGVREVFHARFVEHRYPPHTHDAWTVLIVDDGAIRYDLDRRAHGSGPRPVTVLPPHVVHDGRAADRGGFRKRVVYLDAAVLGDELIGRAVDRPVVRDPALRRALDQLHGTLLHRDDLLAGEAQLATIAEALQAHLARREPRRRAADPALADRLRQLLDAHAFEPITLAEASSVLGASTTHLVRSFSRSFGVSPHAYVVGRRVDAARLRLLEGEPAAAVAVGVGFHDQSHLARHFARHVGTSPGRFAARRRPSRDP